MVRVHGLRCALLNLGLELDIIRNNKRELEYSENNYFLESVLRSTPKPSTIASAKVNVDKTLTYSNQKYFNKNSSIVNERQNAITTRCTTVREYRKRNHHVLHQEGLDPQLPEASEGCRMRKVQNFHELHHAEGLMQLATLNDCEARLLN